MSKLSIEEKLNELEMKLSFQEDLLDTLNKIITRQDKEIQDLWTANKLLKQNMNELKQDTGVAQNEAPPPHY